MTALREPGHCIKCGREIDPDDSLCETCNRAGMSAPSASQYHGTVAAAIVLAVIGLAVAASLSMRGIGPYVAEVRGVAPADAAGYAITYAVRNEGTQPGRAKCQLVALGASGERLRVRSTITEPIGGGQTSEQTETIPGLAEEPDEVTVSCS
jgi:predicted nucleic acid-binding Zn ribbon protein